MRGRQSAATKSLRQEFVLDYFRHFGDATYAQVNSSMAAAATDARFSAEQQAAFAKGAMGPKDLKALRQQAQAAKAAPAEKIEVSVETPVGADDALVAAKESNFDLE